MFGSFSGLSPLHLFPWRILICNLPVRKTLSMVSVSSTSPSKLSNMGVVFKLPSNLTINSRSESGLV